MTRMKAMKIFKIDCGKQPTITSIRIPSLLRISCNAHMRQAGGHSPALRCFYLLLHVPLGVECNHTIMSTIYVKEENRARDQARVQLASIEDMVLRLQHALVCSDVQCADTEDKDGEREEYHDEDAAREAILGDPLDVQVRGAWHAPGARDGAAPYAYKILLCWGGTAVLIVGMLDTHNQPDSARLQYQDWFTPWLDYPLTEAEEQTLLTYAQQFYFDL